MRTLKTGDTVQLLVNTGKKDMELCSGVFERRVNGLLVVNLTTGATGHVTCYRQDLAFVPSVDYCTAEQRKATSLLLIARQNEKAAK